MVVPKSIISNFPFATALFSASFVLAHFLNNIGELSVDVLPIPLIASVIFSQLVFVTCFVLLKKKQVAIAFSCVFVVLFFFYGQIFAIFTFLPAVKSWPNSNFIFFFLWMVLLYFVFRKINAASSLEKINQFFLVTSLIVLIIPVFQIISFQWFRGAHQVKVANFEIKKPSNIPVSSYPDIYYIIPDSYSASKSLQKFYGFDNSSFENFLSEKDFFIASAAASNYPKTFLSLGSSLNMQYLDFLSINKNSSDLALVDPIIKKNIVVGYLKSLGYRYYHLGSWWGATHSSVAADKNFLLEDKKMAGIGIFNYMLLESTALNPVVKPLLSSLTVGNSEDDQRERVVSQFETLAAISATPGPKFVFAHIISPHEPYVFDPDCRPIAFEHRLAFSEEENYIRQVQCINKKFERTIDSILTGSNRPVVMVIQSDEGAPFLAERMNPPDSWGVASDDLLREKFPVFEAIRMPGVSDSMVLYPEISPVNIFRTIFNHYFQTDLPILPDKHFIFPNLKNLYEFQEVTDKIK